MLCLLLLLLFVCKNQLKVFITSFSKSLITERKTNPESKESHFDASSLSMDIKVSIFIARDACLYASQPR